MSETFEEKLEELRKKPVSALSEGDISFLKARRSYLQPHELEEFGLEEEEKQPETKPSKGLSKAQLQEALTAKGMVFEEDATKAHLAGLLDGVADDEEDVQDEE